MLTICVSCMTNAHFLIFDILIINKCSNDVGFDHFNVIESLEPGC